MMQVASSAFPEPVALWAQRQAVSTRRAAVLLSGVRQVLLPSERQRIARREGVASGSAGARPHCHTPCVGSKG